MSINHFGVKTKRGSTITQFPERAEAIAPSDTTTFLSMAVYVGGSGDVVCTPAGGTADVTFTGMAAGTMLPVCVSAVKATGTTATGLVGVY